MNYWYLKNELIILVNQIIDLEISEPGISDSYTSISDFTNSIYR